MTEEEISKQRLAIAEKYNLSVKNPRYFEGHDGVGINVNIYQGKRMLASGYDDARGGCMDINPIGGTKENREAIWKLEESIKNEPQYTDEYGTHSHSLEDIVNALVVKFEEDKERRKDEKKGIMYQSENGVRIALWKGFTIPKLIKNCPETCLGLIQTRYDQIKEKGYPILNTEYLKSIGIKL